MNVFRLVGLLALATLTACGESPAPPEESPDAAVSRPAVANVAFPDTMSDAGPPRVEVVPVAQTAIASHEANAVAVLVNDNDPAAARVLGSAGFGGIEAYDLAGQRLRQIPASGELKSLDILPAPQGGESPWLVALDVNTPALLAFALAPDLERVRPLTLRGADISGAYEGLCAYRDPVDGEAWVFLATGAGKLEQWWLRPGEDGTVDATRVRVLQVPSEVGYCTVDSHTRSLYVAEKEVGIWRFNASVESETVPELVDVVKFGTLGGEVGGLAIYRDGNGAALLVAASVDDGRLQVYDINGDHRLLGSVALAAGDGVDAVDEPGGLAVVATPLGAGLPSGLLAVMDEDAAGTGSNYKLVSWGDMEEALGLGDRVIRDTSTPVTAAFASVAADLETAPVVSPGDAADDPAIWVHPRDAGLSTLIGTNKQGGLYVYDLDGNVRQYLPDGQLNNVDVRYRVPLASEEMDLVTASNRSDASIAIYRVDPESGLLENVADGIQPTGLPEPYGQCMYQHPVSRATYVFINDKSGLYRQWQLVAGSAGTVKAELVREFSVPGQPEGCAADDEYGVLFAGEEDEALWKFSAEPDGGEEGEVVVRIADNPALRDDIEGVAIYYGEDGNGYLVVSSQGNDSYALFQRSGDHAYLGSFVVTANGNLGIDGASETDGLDVISTPLGERFPNGLFIAQDGRNLMPAENQNYKAVDWAQIAAALDLQVHRAWDPRRAVDRR